MKNAISANTKVKTKGKNKRSKKILEKKKKKKRRKNKRKEMRIKDSAKRRKKSACSIVTEAIITKGGGYSLKYIKVCCAFASAVYELIAIIKKSNLIFLIWGLFGSRGTPQLSLRGNGIYQKKQRSKSA